MKNPSMENFSQKLCNNKTKSKNTILNLFACVPARARTIARVSGNSVNYFD